MTEQLILRETGGVPLDKVNTSLLKHSIVSSGCLYLVATVPRLLQLSDLVALVRGSLSRMQRAVLSALIVIEVHAKDVVNKLVQENVVSVHDFEWISQLR